MSQRHSLAAATIHGEAAPERQLRADARRNLEALLNAAQQLLPENPSASMGQIAAHAGVHRATAHRHFASRDELVSAVRARSMYEAITAVRHVVRTSTGSAADRLEAVTAAMLEVGDAYRLYRFTTWRDAATAEPSGEIGEAVRRLVADGQRDGAFRTDMSAERLGVAYGGLFEGVLPEVAEGRMTIAEAAAFVRTMLGSQAT